MGRIGLTRGLVATALALCAALALGCRTPADAGVWHTLRPGENVYRVARYYGVPVSDVLDANRIRDPSDLAVGTRLFIPDPRVRVPPGAPLVPPELGPPSERERLTARGEALERSGLMFSWPLQGRVTSGFGRRGARPHEGIDISGRRGTLVRAAEAGRVIYSASMGACRMITTRP